MMPPPIHMQAQVNSTRLHVNKLLDEIINILSSDGPFVLILSKPNVDLSEKLEMWTSQQKNLLNSLHQELPL